MGTGVSRFGWVDLDAGMAIAAQAIRSFAQHIVVIRSAISLGLHGFSLVEAGTCFLIGAVGAALAAVGRRQTLVLLSGLMAFAGIRLVVSEHCAVFRIAAFVRAGHDPTILTQKSETLQ